jgi:hypothetical protein
MQEVDAAVTREPFLTQESNPSMGISSSIHRRRRA